MPQQAVSLNNPAAVAGMLFDFEYDTKVIEGIAAEVIPYGVGVELDATGTKVRNCQGTGAAALYFDGISVFAGLDQPVIGGVGVGGYQIGDVVKICRRGRIAVQLVGAAIVATDALQTANLSHSSTIATDRGKFTKSVTSGTAGSEIGDVGAKFSRKPVLLGTTNLAVVELNLP